MIFFPRSVLRKGKGEHSGNSSSDLNLEIEERYHALKSKQSREKQKPNFNKLNYQQVTIVDRFGKPQDGDGLG